MCQLKFKLMKRKNLLFYISLTALTMIFFVSCGGGGGNDPFAEFNFLDDSLYTRIDSYYDASIGEQVNPKAGNPKVYIDFSDKLQRAQIDNY